MLRWRKAHRRRRSSRVPTRNTPRRVEDARREGARVTEEARNDSVRIAQLSREQAAADAERIKAQGSQQVNLLHQQKIRELRADLGAESVRRADGSGAGARR